MIADIFIIVISLLIAFFLLCVPVHWVYFLIHGENMSATDTMLVTFQILFVLFATFGGVMLFLFAAHTLGKML